MSVLLVLKKVWSSFEERKEEHAETGSLSLTAAVGYILLPYCEASSFLPLEDAVLSLFLSPLCLAKWRPPDRLGALLALAVVPETNLTDTLSRLPLVSHHLLEHAQCWRACRQPSTVEAEEGRECCRDKYFDGAGPLILYLMLLMNGAKCACLEGAVSVIQW